MYHTSRLQGNSPAAQIVILEDAAPAAVPVTDGQRKQLLNLAARLAEPELGVESRLNLVEQVRRVLNYHAAPEEK